MIRLLAPMAFAAAVAASIVITLLHFLSVRRPPAYLLPTARFIASRDVRAVSRSARPSDLLLLLVRVLALLLAGLALSKPRVTRDQASRATVVVADRAWAPDSVRFREIAGAGEESLLRVVWADSGSDAGMRAELGAAWPLAWREIHAMLAQEHALDSVDLHVLAPPATASFAGWDEWRATWPGGVVVHAWAAADSSDASPRGTARMPPRVEVQGTRGDDVVRAAFALHAPPPAPESTGASPSATTVRVVRTGATDGADADVVVDWPVDGVPGGSRRTTANATATATAKSDTSGAVIARGLALVGRWARSASFDITADASGAAPRVIAWWSDGRPAVVEQARARAASGTARCVRRVAIEVPNGSDLLLSPSASGLLSALVAPCGVAVVPVPARIIRDSAALASPTSRARASAPATAEALRALSPVSAAVTPAWLPAMLLAVAMALLLLEWSVRHRGRISRLDKSLERAA